MMLPPQQQQQQQQQQKPPMMMPQMMMQQPQAPPQMMPPQQQQQKPQMMSPMMMQQQQPPQMMQQQQPPQMMQQQPPQMMQQQPPQAQNNNNNNVSITPGSVNVTLSPPASSGMSPELMKQYAKTMSAQTPVVVQSITKKPDYMKYVTITIIAMLSAIVCIYIYSKFAGGSVEPQYMFATSLADQTVPAGTTSSAPYAVKFPDVSSSAGITATSPSVFSLPAGATYVLTCQLTWSKGNTKFRWANVTTGKPVFIGEEGRVENTAKDTDNHITIVDIQAIANISADVTTAVSLCVISGDGYLIRGQTPNVADKSPWISIESSDRNTHAPATK